MCDAHADHCLFYKFVESADVMPLQIIAQVEVSPLPVYGYVVTPLGKSGPTVIPTAPLMSFPLRMSQLATSQLQRSW